jgi:hypothetical protein
MSDLPYQSTGCLNVCPACGCFITWGDKRGEWYLACHACIVGAITEGAKQAGVPISTHTADSTFISSWKSLVL